MATSLVSTVTQHIPTNAFSALSNAIQIDWSRVGQSILTIQCGLMFALSRGNWLLDVEDPPFPVPGLEVGRGGVGTLLEVPPHALTPSAFRELGRQVWLGVTGTNGIPEIEKWSAVHLFNDPESFVSLVQRVGCEIGVVSYFDSESWLLVENRPASRVG